MGGTYIILWNVLGVERLVASEKTILLERRLLSLTVRSKTIERPVTFRRRHPGVWNYEVQFWNLLGGRLVISNRTKSYTWGLRLSEREVDEVRQAIEKRSWQTGTSSGRSP
jgi:hypothetical protein